jgi:hypothetical protein
LWAWEEQRRRGWEQKAAGRATRRLEKGGTGRRKKAPGHWIWLWAADYKGMELGWFQIWNWNHGKGSWKPKLWFESVMMGWPAGEQSKLQSQ